MDTPRVRFMHNAHLEEFPEDRRCDGLSDVLELPPAEVLGSLVTRPCKEYSSPFLQSKMGFAAEGFWNKRVRGGKPTKLASLIRPPTS